MSLANLLDISHPQDLLRGLNNTLSEYDQTKEDGEKAKIVCLHHYYSECVENVIPTAVV